MQDLSIIGDIDDEYIDGHDTNRQKRKEESDDRVCWI